jgi:hypothetical protein
MPLLITSDRDEFDVLEEKLREAQFEDLKCDINRCGII